MTLSEELSWRGFVNQTTYKDIKALDGEPLTFYLGVDPSADSMQVGNLAIAMLARHFISHGHKAILLVGGATGLIGDPDGKASERELISLEEINTNKQKISAQYQQIFAGQDFEIVDNYDWFEGVKFLDFLRDVGKHVPLRQMLGRDFVASRLEGAGISYAEFSYVLIQAYDFLHLNKEMGVTLQLCGADQWGNSIAGVDLIRRKTGREAHVFSAPLVVNQSTGVKFGKSEAGAIWLDAAKTSPFKFYQFWLNTDDAGVENYLKIYTMLSKEDIETVVTEFTADRAGRKAQKTLAYEVTKLVHGEPETARVQHATEILFGSGEYAKLSRSELEQLAGEFPSVVADGRRLAEYLTQLGLGSSHSDARRLIDSGAIYINGKKCPSDKADLAEPDFLFNKYAVVRRGKNQFGIVQKS